MILLRISGILVLSLLVICCQSPSEPVDSIGNLPMGSLAKGHKNATGSIEFVRAGNNGNQNTDKLNFAEFDVHEERNNQPAAGSFYFRVFGTDLLLHREIVVEVSDVLIDETQDKGWFVGEVISDSKGCGGNNQGGHDSDCGSSDGGDTGDHTDECGGDDSGHDGGCSSDDGTDHTDGGCSSDDGTDHTDGGCSSDDGIDHTDGGSGTTHGNWNVSGKNCRTGQILAVKIHDVASPGADGDGITWKWFHPENPIVGKLNTVTISSWPHLCKKTIIEGNLSVHY